ncbi:hypothetical protein AVEN_194200-1 [Araneus ventricosus]|uniref:Uncharacterized protein n=1 Tax=Araneus ventricosus TaxID=182803 RepID=A0A4Y2JR30_ARAVE|nr:hypothetical protein AVEN_194200-1 [Araneus ventricosus]
MRLWPKSGILEVDSNDIDELVEEHNQELTTEELMELHCVSQQEVMEESLSEEECGGKKVTIKNYHPFDLDMRVTEWTNTCDNNTRTVDCYLMDITVPSTDLSRKRCSSSPEM